MKEHGEFVDWMSYFSENIGNLSAPRRKLTKFYEKSKFDYLPGYLEKWLILLYVFACDT